MLSAVVGAFLYLRIIVTMYFAGPEGSEETTDEPAEFEGPKVRIPAAAGVALGIALVATLALGIVPGPATAVANDATAELVISGN